MSTSELDDPVLEIRCVCKKNHVVNWPSWRTMLDFRCDCGRVWSVTSSRPHEPLADLVHEAAVTLNTIADKVRTLK